MNDYQLAISSYLMANLSFPRKFLSDYSQLPQLVEQYHQGQQKIVFTNGCFDILHGGHVTYLEQAKGLGDILIVGLNSDESVQRLKGVQRPINELRDRATILCGLASVDLVIPFWESTPIELIKIIRPHIYAKGGDYTPETLPETPTVQEVGGIIKTLPFVGDRSTTKLIQKIQGLASS
jgi:D-beta-D-heptose 7-phosphate kinase/D-beta-D-heptose 1-phosphate adenosyltransferase